MSVPVAARAYTAQQDAAVRRVRTRKHAAYYDILDVRPDCSDEEIKRTYRTLALQLHPDKNAAPGADDAFKLLATAYGVLSDPRERAAYNYKRYLESAFASAFAHAAQHHPPPAQAWEEPSRPPQERRAARGKRAETRRAEQQARAAAEARAADDAWRAFAGPTPRKRASDPARSDKVQILVCPDCGAVYVVGADHPHDRGPADETSTTTIVTGIDVLLLAVGAVGLYYCARVLYYYSLPKICLGLGAFAYFVRWLLRDPPPRSGL